MFTAKQIAVCLVLLAASRASAQTTPMAAELVRQSPGGQTRVQKEAPAQLQIQLNHTNGQYQDGDFLRVRVRPTESSHLYMFYHQADGSAVMVYPNMDRKNTRFAGLQTHELPSRNDEIQCVVRGPFEREVVQVIASPVAIEGFENALKESGKSVPVLKTATIDSTCADHAKKEKLESKVAIVTATAR